MRGFQEILDILAKEHNTTPEDVLAEMQRALDEAYDHRTPETQSMWDQLTFPTGRPTAETFVQQMAELLKKKDHHHPWGRPRPPHHCRGPVCARGRTFSLHLSPPTPETEGSPEQIIVDCLVGKFPRMAGRSWAVKEAVSRWPSRRKSGPSTQGRSKVSSSPSRAVRPPSTSSVRRACCRRTDQVS